MKQVMSGMMSCTRLKNYGSQEFVKIWIMGMGKYDQKLPTYWEISQMTLFDTPEQLRYYEDT